MKTPSNEYGIMPLSKPKGRHGDGKDSEHIQSCSYIFIVAEYILLSVSKDME